DGAVRIDRSLEELRSTEFIPFSAGIEAGVDFVMVGHQIMTEVDADTPSDLSHAVVTDLLKQELGFKGLAITDAQNMNTISANYSSGEAAVLAIQAGIDIVLMPVNLTEAVEGVYQAVQDGTISEERIDESVQKILLQKQRAGLL
ncbi:MAG: glycoside hydrolase family 3 N-terminal domain-containing protein, partial [Ruminococcus sp.]